ncbi:aerobic C4-dicarboxylate transport protein [Pseudoduganella lurida]|uniref:Aerobic C4-dicarboxylate transport protein n=1 Tax=Pseudoduganella lurida TaxID=1036180 RepID=A0A562REF9_9BURK|nr:cation:dicarboxylase symporter family transporter [Pseudoduganella lurida]TWI67452.1 aerobic C4-dicarboxylate transport protein [Pseudoduganella lurida]
MRAPFQILPLALAIGAGLALGLSAPVAAVQMHFLGEAFIRLLGWVMCPLIFCMLVDGAAALGRNRTLGRLGVAMLLYFSAMSVLSMLAGLAAGWVLEPGIGMASAAGGAALAGGGTMVLPAWMDYLPPVHVNNLVVLALALPVGLAAGLWPRVSVLGPIHAARKMLLAAVRMILWLSPAAAFGAMAAAVGRGGLAALLPLLRFVVAINLASVLFILVVFGCVARLVHLSLPRLVVFLRDELVLVTVTGATLAALAPLSDKLARLGCPRRLTDIVLPFSYSLNLAGTYLYIAMALVFLAEASSVQVGWHELAAMLGVGLLSSKSAVGVAGSGFATLAATAALLHVAPADTVALLLAIDRTMKCRLLTNVIGHALACIVLAASDGTLEREALREGLARG